jgi:hypothetical protein
MMFGILNDGNLYQIAGEHIAITRHKKTGATCVAPVITNTDLYYLFGRYF